MPQDHDRRLARRQEPVSGRVEDYEAQEPLDEDPSPEDVARFGDVTIKCPECGTEMYDDVALCWKCGAAVQPGARTSTGLPLWAIVTTAVLVGLFLLGLMVF